MTDTAHRYDFEMSGTSVPVGPDEIDVQQRWLDRIANLRFTVLRTYRDHPTNPSYLIRYDRPHDGQRIVRLVFFQRHCERIAVNV